MTEVSELTLMPFNRSPGGSWSEGSFVSLDGADVGPVAEADVAEVIYHWNSGDEWDGDEVAVMKLKDGRFIGYEAWWGPTGDGFSEDAYGGDANLYFAKDLDTIERWALGEESRNRLGIELTDDAN